MKVRSKIKIIKEISLVYKLKDIRKKKKRRKIFLNSDSNNLNSILQVTNYYIKEKLNM